MAGVAIVFSHLLDAFVLLIFVWTLGSWMTQWRYQEWYKALDRIVSPYIDVFRPLNLNFSGVDFTPMAAVFAIYLFRTAVLWVAFRGSA